MSAGVQRVETAPGYTMIPQKFYHPNAGRKALGLVGGNEVSVPAGNLVDVESDLFGHTRDLSKVPSRNYQAPQGKRDIVFTERSTGRTVTVYLHLSPWCEMSMVHSGGFRPCRF